MTRAAGAGKWNAIADERALADFCEAARVRSAFVRRVAHSIRSEGAAAAGAQLRAHAAATAVRLRECVIVQLFGAEQRCALIAAVTAPRRGGVGLRHAIWRRWASLPFEPAAACRNPGFAGVLHFVSALRVRPASIGGIAGPLLPPTPAIPAPVAVVLKE
ncbi:hypothetical protein FPZ54_12425 [Sphingomonas suaedae]|uniref:Uncharacterized protein n=1 Tax=Sphingomonas suaedae TaxID=2599297 RepID=A0A518RH26_9SPHN|nr:hypothetical protein [Sphingomonas suaedae]QDX26734.1 hypothetical protein FPZ54_12425 [Sphingomonas suaedae]